MSSRTVLSSGLTVITETLPWVRSAALGFYVKSGSAAEPEALAGASHFLEHLLFKRTESRSTHDIARLIDMLGGDVDAFTSKEYTGFYVHALDEQLDDALELLLDILLHPRFTDDDVESERRVILEEIRMVEDTPDDLVHELFVAKFWAGHPLGRPILGPEERVTNLSRSALEAHMRETFHPRNMIFCASGNILPERIIERLEREFSAADREIPPPWTTPSPHPHVELRKKRDLEQVHISIGLAGLAQESEDRYAVALMANILGGGMSSRLFQNVREKEGLVYSISASHSGYRKGGYMTIDAACNPDYVPRVLDLTFAEVVAFRRNGATADELAAAKRNVKGGILLSLESTVSRMSGMASQEYYFGQQFTPDQLIEEIDSVTLADVDRTSKSILQGTSAALTLLGNLKKAPLKQADLREALA